MMVDASFSAGQYMAVLFNLLVTGALPVAIAVFVLVKCKKQGLWLPLLVGAGVFFVAQVCVRLPIIQIVLPLVPGYQEFAQSHIWLYILFLSLTAGLFEEGGRFLAFTLLKKYRKPMHGLAYGIGHGGIESMVIVAAAMVNNLVFMVLISTGAFDALRSVLGESQAALIENQLLSATPMAFLMGALERVSAMAVHIALSVAVLQGFRVNRRWLYLGLAVAGHTVFNFVLVGLAQAMAASPWGIYVSEGAGVIMAAAGVAYVLYVFKKDKENTPPEVLA